MHCGISNIIGRDENGNIYTCLFVYILLVELTVVAQWLRLCITAKKVVC